MSSGTPRRPSAWRARHRLLVRLPQRARHVGLHERGRDRVDPHAGRELLRELAGEVDQRGLRHVVRADERTGPQSADRDDVQDHAAVLVHVLVPRGAGEAQRCGDVRVEDLRDRAEVGVHQRAEHGIDRGVVDDDVAAPERVDHRRARRRRPRRDRRPNPRPSRPARRAPRSRPRSPRARPASGRRRTTSAPAAALASAIARPMPRVPPVTSTALPSIRSAVAGSITGRAPCRPRCGATRPRARRARAG